MKDVLGTYFDTPNLLDESLPAAVVAENNLDQQATPPTVACQIYQSLKDEVVPYQVTDELVAKWGSQGACIDYTRDRVSAHVILCFTGTPMALRWMQDRLDGVPIRAQPGKPYIETVVTSLDTSDAVETLGMNKRNDMQTLLETQYRQPGRIWWT